MSRLLSILILCLSVGSAYAEIYKWQDSNGKVGYGNVPPSKADTNYQEFVSKTSSVVVAGEKKIDNSINTEREKKIKEDKERETKEAAQNCAKSKESLQMLDSGVRVVRYNAQGEREVLDDKARAQETQNAKRAISEWCIN